MTDQRVENATPVPTKPSPASWDRPTMHLYLPQSDEALSAINEAHKLYVFVLERPARHAKL